MSSKSNNIALVTGASKGIGAEIALRLAHDGYHIWLNYRSSHDLAQKVQERIEDAGGSCQLMAFDVASEEQVSQVLVPCLQDRCPDVLVNNAGFNKDSLMMWMSREDWESVLNVNLLGFFLVTKQILMGMMKRKSGRIINIASTAGQSGMGGQVNYSAAKAGLIGATKSLAAELAPRGILVNAVAPGFVDTEMTAELPKDDLKKLIPLKRFGTSEEIAGVVSFLCSDDAAYVVGQVIGVNGGLYT